MRGKLYCRRKLTKLLKIPPKKTEDIVELTPKQIIILFKFANVRKKDVFYDLGSGHGNIVIEAIKQRKVKKAIGIELTKKFYIHSRKKAIEKFDKTQLKNNIDFWYGDYDGFVDNDTYNYDITDATVVFNSLDPNEDEVTFYNTQFRSKSGIKIIKKDLPLVGYKPVSINQEDRSMYFYLMKTPLYRHRTKSKSEWARLVLRNDGATIKKVYQYYEKQLVKREIEKPDIKDALIELKLLVREFLPKN